MIQMEKLKEIKRRFNNINTRASEADIKSFVTTISNLIEESFDKVEVVKLRISLMNAFIKRRYEQCQNVRTYI